MRCHSQSQLQKLSNRPRFFFARKHKIPFVLSAHGSLLGYQHYLPAGLSHFPYKLYDRITRKLPVKKAQAVVVSTQFEKEDAQSFGVQEDRIHIIPMGIDLPAIDPSTATSGPLRILVVGRLARVRRIEQVIKAVSHLKFPYRLTLVGGEEKTSSVSKKGYFAELKSLVKNLGIGQHVHFEGRKHPEALPAYYKDADVFVYPSLYENFGQPLLEAAAYGLPLIASKVGVACDLIEEGRTGFFTTGQPEEIADQLYHLTSIRERNAFGQVLREKVEASYSWGRVMDQYLNLYSSL